jgi:hypothetical protein
MMYNKFNSLTKASILVVMTGMCGSVLAQPAASNQSSNGVQASQFSAGAYLGFTDDEDTEFTYGAELEFRNNDPWSAGVIIEKTENMYFNNDLTVLMGTANYRPFPDRRLKLTGGLGVAFNEGADDDTVLRAGVGYDLFLELPIVVTPRVALDFFEGDERLIYDVTAFYNF